MEAKHTPEPWKVVEHHGAIDVMGVGSGVCRVFTDPNQDSLPTMPQARANARIIAAAPAMLGALQDADKALAALIVTFHEESPKCSKGYTFPALTTLNAIRDTIARATGGGK